MAIKNRAATNKIIVHCSATYPSQDIDAATVRGWHVNKNQWADIGYHFFIKRDGTIEEGRKIYQVGAHVAGHNSDSIGICLAGGIKEGSFNSQNRNGIPENNFTPEQFKSLKKVIKETLLKYPDCEIKGHRDFDFKKACPCFDVGPWWASVNKLPETQESGTMLEALNKVLSKWGYEIIKKGE